MDALPDRELAVKGMMRLEARFWMKVRVAPADSCWEWLAGVDRSGYGKFQLDGRPVGAHRVAYRLAVGPIPTGLELDHLCRTPACVNPAHLEAVTQRVNFDRSTAPAVLNRGKTRCHAGHPFDEANTYHWKGHRICRACNAAAAARCKARRNQEILSSEVAS